MAWVLRAEMNCTALYSKQDDISEKIQRITDRAFSFMCSMKCYFANLCNLLQVEILSEASAKLLEPLAVDMVIGS